MKRLILSLATIVAATTANAQYTTPHHHLILDEKHYDMIVGESSGESALRAIYDIAPYEKNRTQKEYNSRIFEIDYIYNSLKNYGFDNAKIDTYDDELTIWDGVKGSLWEVSPTLSKIADYNDLTAMLAPGSNNANVETELIWIGRATKEEIERVDLKGKIAVAEGSMPMIARAAKEAGAVGVVNIVEPRAISEPLQIPNSSIGRGAAYEDNIFGFFVTSRAGRELRNRLIRGEKIVVKAEVEVTKESFKVEAPWVTIEGSDKSSEGVILSAHLLEGYTKLGANDNASGSAALLEAARMLKTLIDNGDLPRPKRSVHFVWGDEFTATIPWANNNRNIIDKALCNINLDMVGVNLADNQSFYTLSRTTFGNSHYINDVSESIYRYLGESGLFGSDVKGKNMKKVVAPSGSNDPFLYLIESFSSGSDHQVFNDWNIGVPAVLMITWPDNNYHTSGDRPSTIDPTMMKRAVVIAATAAYTIASADEAGALRIASEVGALGATRLGYYRGKAISEIADSLNSGANIDKIAKRAINDIKAVAKNELNTLNTVIELAPESQKLATFIEGQKAIVVATENEMISSAKLYLSTFGEVDSRTLKASKEELECSKIFPKATQKVYELPYGSIRTVTKEISDSINGFAALEVALLGAKGENSILDIKRLSDFQTGEDCSLEDLKKYFNFLEKEGYVTFEK